METQTNLPMQEKKGSDTKKIVVLLGIIMIVIIGLGLQLEAEQTTSDRFYHTETINGIEVKGLTIQEATELLSQQYLQVTPAITLIQLSEMKLNVDSRLLGFELVQESIQENLNHILNSQFSLYKPSSWIYDKHRQLDIEYTFQQELLEDGFLQLQQLLMENGTFIENENAYLHFDTDLRRFEIVPEKYGNKLSYERLSSALSEFGSFTAAGSPADFTGPNYSAAAFDLEKWDCYEVPVVTAESLEEDCIFFNQNFTTDINISVTEDTVKTLEPIEYLSFFNISVEDADIRYDSLAYLGINEAVLYEYIANYCNSLNTLGTKRMFTTSGGQEIALTSGNYGWWVNRQKSYENVLNALNSLMTETPVYTAEIIYNQTAALIPDAERGIYDFGNSYIEISIASQYLWYYIDGALFLETAIVSGNPNNSQGTPSGIYSITYKERNATLTGPNYRTPVDYWMPFNGDIGLHDATWQPTFGGNRYLTNGSNGCINLPYDKAASIYEHLKQFDPVIVY